MDAIILKNVSKQFRAKEKTFTAVNNVTLSIKKGEIFGLLGPNGAGKTTLLNMILGLVEQDEGTIRVLGQNPLTDPTFIEKVGFVSPQATFHWILSSREVLTFFAKAHRLSAKKTKTKVTELLCTFGLEKSADKPFDELSTGQRMRLMLARALLNDPEIIILDEPTLGLDPHIAQRVRLEIKRINKERGATIILTSHYMQEVEALCERVAFIAQGSIIDIGLVKEVTQKHFLYSDVLIETDDIINSAALEKKGIHVKGKKLFFRLKEGEDVSAILAFLHKLGMKIKDVQIKKPSLEDYFIKMMDTKQNDTRMS